MVAGPTFDVERTSLSGGTVGVERVAIGRLIILVAGKLAACAHADDASAWLYAFAARRTVGIERTRHRREGRQQECQSGQPASSADRCHGSSDPSRMKHQCTSSTPTWPW